MSALYATHVDHETKRGIAMLWTIAVICLFLWALGLLTAYSLGGFIHILLVLAVILVLVRFIQGRRVV
jgi:low affinity Fe/Cu permease